MLLKVIFKSEVYVCKNKFTNILHIYDSYLLRAFPWNMGAYYRDTNLYLLLDVLDINNEDATKNKK